MWTTRTLGMALMVAALVVAACEGNTGSGGDKPPVRVQEGTPVPKREVKDVVDLLDEQARVGASYKGTVDVSGLSAVRMVVGGEATVGETGTLTETSFAPTVLVGEPGQELTLVLEHLGAIFHTFSIAEQGLEVELNSGQTKQVTVTFPTGDEPIMFYCRPHDIGGMVGALVARD
jgi:plastocyanin